jgi:hypothetical protein
MPELLKVDEDASPGARARVQAPEAPAAATPASGEGASNDDAGGEGGASSKKERFAENLRMPVSNLVRAILEDAVQAADAAGESVEGRLKRAAQQLGRERERLKRRVLPDQHFAGVYAFQPVTLAQPVTCAKCGRALGRGDHAHLGMVEPPPKSPADRIFVCETCLPHA